MCNSLVLEFIKIAIFSSFIYSQFINKREQELIQMYILKESQKHQISTLFQIAVACILRGDLHKLLWICYYLSHRPIFMLHLAILDSCPSISKELDFIVKATAGNTNAP